MVNINPGVPERVDTGKYEMFTAQEHPKPPPRKVTPYAAGSGLQIFNFVTILKFSDII